MTGSPALLIALAIESLGGGRGHQRKDDPPPPRQRSGAEVLRCLQIPRLERVERSEEQKHDQWMVRFSKAVGKNLGPFFTAWGIPTSEAARESIKDLPVWMRS